MGHGRDYWDKKHVEYALQDWIEKPSIFATQAVTHFPPQGVVLDLGAGQGQDSIFFAQQGYDVVVADYSKKALDLAKKRAPADVAEKLTFQEVDLLQPLPYPPDSFDVVYSHLGLHFFDSLRTQQLFDEIYAILKPGGVFAALANTVDDPDYGKGEELEKHYFETLHGIRVRYFSCDSMKQFASKFQIVLVDANGETYKDAHRTLIRLVAKKQ